jgi:hypothetical protein
LDSSVSSKVAYLNAGIMPVLEDAVRIKSALWTLTACILFSLPAVSQGHRHPIPQGDATSGSADDNDAHDRMLHDMVKKANEERAAALKADADKLLKLAVELKAYVEKSNENVLSLDVIKKAEEIEKLAHTVKDKMKGPN